MENDSIRASGTDTLVDIWIDGKLRAISITNEAIAAFVGFEQAGLSDEQRCEFIRTHLPQVVVAVKLPRNDTAPDADTVVIDVGQGGDKSQQDRRKDERRKTDRRKASRSTKIFPWRSPSRRPAQGRPPESQKLR
jgi:hypothetical protein